MVNGPAQLQDIIGHRFADLDLLARALVHASSTEERGNSNERLEFLGDRVLGLVIAQALFLRYPNEVEGELARRYAGLTSREALVRVAGTLALDRFILAQHGDKETAKRSQPSVAADTLEAVLGALYLDGGLEPAEAFINKHWDALMEEDLSPPKDAKTALQEWAQGRGLGLPQYEVMSREGPDHAPIFTLSVAIKGHGARTGQGGSRRTAEQAAADALLKTLMETKK
ncbi:MAG TPA: ribonuclease III [Magnetovibrio sp.]